MIYANCAYGQKIIADTVLIACKYGQYCESVLVCETIIPDSIYVKYNGALPDPETEGMLKYRSNCYEVGYDNHLGELYGYKDFILSIGGFQMEYSFPQYSYYLKLNELIGSQIELVNSKNGETVKLNWIEVTNANSEHKSFNGKEQNEEIISYLKTQNHNSIIELKISPIKYPNNDQLCGSVIQNFPSIKIQIIKD